MKTNRRVRKDNTAAPVNRQSVLNRTKTPPKTYKVTVLLPSGEQLCSLDLGQELYGAVEQARKPIGQALAQFFANAVTNELRRMLAVKGGK